MTTQVANNSANPSGESNGRGSLDLCGFRRSGLREAVRDVFLEIGAGFLEAFTDVGQEGIGRRLAQTEHEIVAGFRVLTNEVRIVWHLDLAEPKARLRLGGPCFGRGSRPVLPCPDLLHQQILMSDFNSRPENA